MNLIVYHAVSYVQKYQASDVCRRFEPLLTVVLCLFDYGPII